jgi:hypothetical protein
MERNFDLVCRILVDIRRMPAGESLDEISYPEYDQPTVYGHVDLLVEAGLVKAKILKYGDGIEAIHVAGLTWDGHDFLDAAKDDSLWQKAKDTVLKPGVSITFGLLLEWLKAEAKQKLGLP